MASEKRGVAVRLSHASPFVTGLLNVPNSPPGSSSEPIWRTATRPYDPFHDFAGSESPWIFPSRRRCPVTPKQSPASAGESGQCHHPGRRLRHGSEAETGVTVRKMRCGLAAAGRNRVVPEPAAAPETTSRTCCSRQIVPLPDIAAHVKSAVGEVTEWTDSKL